MMAVLSRAGCYLRKTAGWLRGAFDAQRNAVHEAAGLS